MGEGAARRDSWSVEPMGEHTIPLPFGRWYPADEFARISRGLVPRSADEDLWFVYVEDGTAYFHRSAGGEFMFRVRFAPEGGGWRAMEALADADPRHRDDEDPEYTAALIGFLIDVLLLEKDVPFPYPADAGSSLSADLFQLIFSGTEQPEMAFERQGRASEARGGHGEGERG